MIRHDHKNQWYLWFLFWIFHFLNHRWGELYAGRRRENLLVFWLSCDFFFIEMKWMIWLINSLSGDFGSIFFFPERACLVVWIDFWILWTMLRMERIVFYCFAFERYMNYVRKKNCLWKKPYDDLIMKVFF